MLDLALLKQPLIGAGQHIMSTLVGWWSRNVKPCSQWLIWESLPLRYPGTLQIRRENASGAHPAPTRVTDCHLWSEVFSGRCHQCLESNTASGSVLPLSESILCSSSKDVTIFPGWIRTSLYPSSPILAWYPNATRSLERLPVINDNSGQSHPDRTHTHGSLI